MKRFSLGGVAILAHLTVPALAADLPSKPIHKAPPVAAAANWSGLYIGLNAGYGWGRDTDPAISFTDPAPGIGFADYFSVGGNRFPNLKPKGFIGGGQVGWDRQWSSLVAGVVADFQISDINNSATVLVPLNIPSTETLSQRLDFLGTVRARVGMAFNDWLLYGTGGFAYGHVKNSLNFVAPTVPILVTGSTSETRAGWAAGVGVNYAVANWVLGIEYLHYDLGRSSVTASTVVPALPASTLTATQRVDGDIVRGTLSYRFNSGPVVGRY